MLVTPSRSMRRPVRVKAMTPDLGRISDHASAVIWNLPLE